MVHVMLQQVEHGLWLPVSFLFPPYSDNDHRERKSTFKKKKSMGVLRIRDLTKG